ncbi:hypothetical protein COCVIDRAFT_38473 [Bipolaris victoriae FI3]|uniref:Rhodopsin domain-containing protein n=1 Tax=Bipolaris victoriae (strain FI3) TaxID=930091 RepID=W7E6V6_BIPV3|nr:hypothetical protein COCVIDRAFT_38473 [Bipolaris victoriae FI3]
MLVKCLGAERPDPGCPALMPPTGEMPLNPNASTIWPWGLPIIITCFALTGIAMMIRIFTRAYLTRLFTFDDAVMIAATVTYFAFVSVTLDSISMGFGKHQWNVTVGEGMRALRRAYWVQIVYCIAMYTTKLGVLLQIKSTFNSKSRDFMFWSCWACIVSFSCVYTASLFTWIFPCNPIKKKWDPFIPGTCLPTHAGPSLLSGIINLVTDVALLFLPIYVVSRLQMSIKKKFAVSAIFGAALLACVSSAVRLHYTILHLDSKDNTYWLAILAVCAIIEISALLLCGAFPTFPHFAKWLGYGFKWQSTGYTVTNSGKDSRSNQSDTINLTDRQQKSVNDPV